MIKRIEQIQNIGQFESFQTREDFDKNTIIFGFNGAGKSTLSDMFYSLAHSGNESLLIRRRTLNREGEDTPKQMLAEIVSDIGEYYTFSGEKWGISPENMFVFNEQYVTDHVFVSKQIEEGSVPIGMGKEGARLMRQKDLLVEQNNQLIKSINTAIEILMNDNIKIKDFSTSKIKRNTPIKRFEKMSELSLFQISEKAIIEERIKNNTKYNNIVRDLDKCDELYEEIKNVQSFSVATLLKKVRKVPRISSKEIATFLSETMTPADIKWAVKGYAHRKADDVCPLCGQKLSEKRAIDLFERLGKYISQNKGEKVKEFSQELNMLAVQLQTNNLKTRKGVFAEILEILNKNKLLLKKDTERLVKGLRWTEQNDFLINAIIEKIYEKAENPYADIELSDEESRCIALMNDIIKNIILLGRILGEARERLNKKMDRSISSDDMRVLFGLSYGIHRREAEEIKANALQYIKYVRKIEELNQFIDDCYNQSRLVEVNELLQKLNTHIKIEVKNKKYYIKLKDFKAQELNKNGYTIFSEGEHRAIAFAYFLAEIESKEIKSNNRIIVIDDPISSMDLSRKSIISHHIAEMMNTSEWQVIIMTHDISFVERVHSYLDSQTTCKLMELRSGKRDFMSLRIEDYLTDDGAVYEELIKDAENNGDEVSKIIALMSLRPYSYVKKVSADDYKKVEKSSTYFAHTLYAKNGRITFKQKDYSNNGLKKYAKYVSKITGKKFDGELVVGEYAFEGFDFNKIVNIYISISMDSMKNMRKKVLLMRPLIEACFFQFSIKEKFDPEHIGKMYSNTIRSNSGDKIKQSMCLRLQEIYDSSKKYHHGAEDGSLLGISWINPNEVEFYDEVITKIIEEIRNNGMVRALSAS